MKHFRHLTLVILILAVALLTACQSTSNNKTDNDAKSNTGEKTDSANTASDNNKEKTTINFWFPGTDDGTVNAINAMKRGFEASHPDIVVQYTSIPWQDWFQKLSVAYAGGIAPDVHLLGNGQFTSTVSNGNYMDLNALIQKDNWEGKDDFFADVLKAGQWNGGQYGLMMPSPFIYSWRKDFFKEANLDPEKPPQTVEEMLDYADKLTVKKDGKTMRAGIDIQTGNGEISFLSILLLMGADIYDDNGNPTFDSPESIQLLEKLVTLFKNGNIMPANQQQLDGIPYKNGLAAQAIIGLGDLRAAAEKTDAGNFGYDIPPMGASNKHTVLNLGDYLAMSKFSKHPDEAWEFIKYFFSPEPLLEMTKATGYVPPLKSLIDQYANSGPMFAKAVESLNDAQSYRPSPNWNTIVKYLRVGLEEAYYDKKTPEQAMKDNAGKAREELGIK